MCNLLLAACSTDDGMPITTSADTQPIAFRAAVGMDGSVATRAQNSIESNTVLSNKRGFGVFGCYTGLHKYVDSSVNPDFMYNEHVTSTDDGTTWTYSPIKYWPNGEGEVSGNMGENAHYVSFMAYAPYSDHLNPDPDNVPADYCIAGFSHQGEQGNPWLTYRLHTDVAKQVDLLYASHTNEHPLLDWTKPSVTTKVPFVFEHALSCVGDKLTINCSEGIRNQIASRVANSTITNAMVVVTGIQIEYALTSKARLVLWNNGEANWQTIWSEEPITTRTVTILDPEDNTDDIPVYAYNTTIPSEFSTTNTWTGNGIFYIPVELTGYQQTATVNITHCIATYSGSSWKYDVKNTGKATIKLKDYSEAYQSGKHLYINITLNQVDIALTAAIADWVTITQEVEGIEE